MCVGCRPTVDTNYDDDGLAAVWSGNEMVMTRDNEKEWDEEARWLRITRVESKVPRTSPY